MIWHVTEHKGQRGWHGPEPYWLTVSSRGYIAGTKLDSKPRPGLGKRTGGGKQARGCVLPWSTAGCLLRCLSVQLVLPSNGVTAQWLHLSLCRHDSKWKQQRCLRNGSTPHIVNTSCKEWEKKAHAYVYVDMYYTSLCLNAVKYSTCICMLCSAIICCLGCIHSVMTLGVILAKLMAWWAQRQMFIPFSGSWDNIRTRAIQTIIIIQWILW